MLKQFPGITLIILDMAILGVDGILESQIKKQNGALMWFVLLAFLI